MYTYFFENCRVVDGDTIEGDLNLGLRIVWNKCKIRFSQINTPECNSKEKLEKQCALFCKDFVQKLIENKVVVVKTEHPDSTDSFGRLLGFIFLFDSKSEALNTINLNPPLNSLNQLLLDRKLAFKYGIKWKDLNDSAKSEYLSNITELRQLIDLTKNT